MNEIEFFCIKRSASVIIPISECYKLKTRKKAHQYCYTVNAIDPHGHRLSKLISKEAFDHLLCRTVDYNQKNKV